MRQPHYSKTGGPTGLGKGKDLSLLRPRTSPNNNLNPEEPYLDIASRVKEKKRECVKKSNLSLSEFFSDDDDEESLFKDDSHSDPDFTIESEKPIRSDEEFDENVEFFLEKPRRGRRPYRRDSNGQKIKPLPNTSGKKEFVALTQQPVPSASSNIESNFENSSSNILSKKNNDYDSGTPKKPGFASSFEFQDKNRIPRPPNAFMIFANEWRKHIARVFPSDSNKTISVRLGQHWKVLNQESKAVYYSKAQKISHLHSMRYPHYSYNPKEARVRKAQRDALKSSTRNASQMLQHSFPQMGSATPNSANFLNSYSSPNLASGASLSGGSIIGGTSGSRSQPGQPTIRNRQPTYPGPSQAYPNLEHQRDFSLSYPESSYGYYNNVAPGPSTAESHTEGLFGHSEAAQYPNSSVWGEGSNQPNTMMWATPPTYPMGQERSNMDYGNFSTNDAVPMPTAQTGLMSNGGSLDCNGSFDFTTNESYPYQKQPNALNILTPKDLNNSIKAQHRGENMTSKKHPMIKTEELYSYKTHPLAAHPSAPNYHANMSPKTHSEETRMSPYNHPILSPHNTPIEPSGLMSRTIDPCPYPSPKSSKSCYDLPSKSSPKLHSHGESTRKSPKAHHKSTERISPSFKHEKRAAKQSLKQETRRVVATPPVEKHPLPAFKQAFGSTERGRLLATPVDTPSEVTNDIAADNNDYEFLNMELFAEEKNPYDEMNQSFNDPI